MSDPTKLTDKVNDYILAVQEQSIDPEAAVLERILALEKATHRLRSKRGLTDMEALRQRLLSLETDLNMLVTQSDEQRSPGRPGTQITPGLGQTFSRTVHPLQTAPVGRLSEGSTNSDAPNTIHLETDSDDDDFPEISAAIPFPANSTATHSASSISANGITPLMTMPNALAYQVKLKEDSQRRVYRAKSSSPQKQPSQQQLLHAAGRSARAASIAEITEKFTEALDGLEPRLAIEPSPPPCAATLAPLLHTVEDLEFVILEASWSTLGAGPLLAPHVCPLQTYHFPSTLGTSNNTQHIQDQSFFFPSGVIIEIERSPAVVALKTSPLNYQRHIVPFTDRRGRPLYAACLTVTCEYPSDSLPCRETLGKLSMQMTAVRVIAKAYRCWRKERASKQLLHAVPIAIPIKSHGTGTASDLGSTSSVAGAKQQQGYFSNLFRRRSTAMGNGSLHGSTHGPQTAASGTAPAAGAGAGTGAGTRTAAATTGATTAALTAGAVPAAVTAASAAAAAAHALAHVGGGGASTSTSTSTGSRWSFLGSGGSGGYGNRSRPNAPSAPPAAPHAAPPAHPHAHAVPAVPPVPTVPMPMDALDLEERTVTKGWQEYTDPSTVPLDTIAESSSGRTAESEDNCEAPDSTPDVQIPRPDPLAHKHVLAQKAYILISPVPCYVLLFKLLEKIAECEAAVGADSSVESSVEPTHLHGHRTAFLRQAAKLIKAVPVQGYEVYANFSVYPTKNKVLAQYACPASGTGAGTGPASGITHRTIRPGTGTANYYLRVNHYTPTPLMINRHTCNTKEWSLAVLLTHVSIPNIIKILNLLLLEKSLVVYGTCRAIVTACVVGIVQLISPFTWEGIFLPIVPDNGRELFSAPVPLIIGTVRKPSVDDKMDVTAVLYLEDEVLVMPTGHGHGPAVEGKRMSEEEYASKFKGPSPSSSALNLHLLGGSFQSYFTHLPSLSADLLYSTELTHRMTHCQKLLLSFAIPRLQVRETHTKPALAASSSASMPSTLRVHNTMDLIVMELPPMLLHEIKVLLALVKKFNYSYVQTVMESHRNYKMFIKANRQQEEEFVPDQFLEPLRCGMEFQEAVVHTQLFVSFMDKLRKQSTVLDSIRVFISSWIYKQHLRRKALKLVC